MPDSYVVLWTRDRCRDLKQLGEEGKPLEVLYGGAHISTPSFTPFGVSPGVFVYPL